MCAMSRNNCVESNRFNYDIGVKKLTRNLNLNSLGG